MKGSRALELWEAWQRASSDRNKAQQTLDNHMRELERASVELLTRYPST